MSPALKKAIAEYKEARRKRDETAQEACRLRGLAYAAETHEREAKKEYVTAAHALGEAAAEEN